MFEHLAFDDVAGLEKMNPERFRQAFVVRKPSQAPTKFDLWDTMQLPNNSVLHTLNGFDTLVSPNGGLPDPEIPLLTNEKFQIWAKINSLLATEASHPFGINDSYVYRPNLLNTQIFHWYSLHKRFHMIRSEKSLGTLNGVLTWVDYSPLNEARVTGTLASYRKFDLLFRTILDTISKIGHGKNHYLVLKQSGEVFAKTLFQKAFKELTTSSLNAFSHDPSAFALIHLLGYVYGQTHSLNVVPYKEDVRILGKGDTSLSGVKSTSLLERLDPDLLSSINIILQKDNFAVVYNLGDLKNFSEDTSFYPKFYRHLMSLRLNTANVPDHQDLDNDQFDDLVENKSSEETPVVSETNPVVTPVTPEAVAATDSPAAIIVTHSPETDVKAKVDKPNFEERLRQAVHEHTTPIIQLEPKKESRRNILVENHFGVTLSGKPLGELVQEPDVTKITPKKMGFITSAPEPSYQKSSLLALDRSYHDIGYKHDMAKVLGSLAKHGMFITKIEESKTETEMDQLTTFRVNITDLSGKTHYIKYTIPDVDENGLMKIGGNQYRGTRQIANIPICKTAYDRVNLSSYFNKIIVERVKSKRNSYEQDTQKVIMRLRSQGLVSALIGSAPLPTQAVAYDYSAIGRHFTELKFGEDNGYVIHFGANGAPMDQLNASDVLAINADQKKYGIYVGRGPGNSYLYWELSNKINLVMGGNQVKTWGSFHQMLSDVIGEEATPDRTPVEWTQANIINQTIPLVYILSYRFGLKTVLDMIRLDYRFYTDKSKVVIYTDDLAVPMADGVLVFNRYPLAKSLIAAGLLWADLKNIQFNDLSVPDTYQRILQQKKMGTGVGVLKGLNGFFDFFVDPITEKVLEKMGEPITFHELLLRADSMLTDYHALESSSISLHRFRLYERFNGFLYNEVYRALQNHRSNPASKKSFSINPEAVFQKIVQDATISPHEMINPVHEVKQISNVTFTGGNGRNANSLVLKDRIYPKDGLGVLSDAVPDSGKVGITSYLSASPRIDDIHGLPISYKTGDKLEPPEILSIGSMVMPGGTTDDGKRNSYLSIQISHYVPNHDDGETLSVRTGYDAVLPHLSSQTFATSADDNGIVESIDDKQKVLRVRYADTPTETIRSIKLPYLDSVVDSFRASNHSFGFLIPDTEISHYPIGGVFSLTKNSCGKIADRLRFETVDAIPDKDILRKQPTLIQDLTKGKYKALYYLRFTPLGVKTPGEVKSYSFTNVYSQNSGSYLLQTRKPNVKVGDSFKQGDILIYNPGFFVPDPMSKQVTFKHGVVATVALVEKSSNHEDACEISRDMSNRLKMTPCHQREIVTKADSVVLKIVKIGDHVETSDSLCVISDDYLVGSSYQMNAENVDNLDIVEKLSRQAPAADYTGYIRKIRILYGCEREQLSESLKVILKAYEKEVRDNFKALNHDPSAKPPERPGWVAPGTKYVGIDFTKDTVIIEFMIEETLSVSEGDKVCLSLSNKSIVSYVNEKPHFSESGEQLDFLFSTTSVVNRIVASPFLNGMSERNMEKLKQLVVDMYFDS